MIVRTGEKKATTLFTPGAEVRNRNSSLGYSTENNGSMDHDRFDQ